MERLDPVFISGGLDAAPDPGTSRLIVGLPEGRPYQLGPTPLTFSAKFVL
jgi:hypothetical protein